ncbi:hypothetical protein CTAYLR_002738 [Chrysophaeum taylorii]|uniref:Uncharacterized protein n=1 Tax=Chrysophaeum taylorii TaxID=2483200 RepID=A0AAD7XL03_9STRA|nr:hypothetical protein CTAYLR_002738 [Chrysophaeum taylorii]
MERLSYYVNVSSQPVSLYAWCLLGPEEEEEGRAVATVERLMPGRCCAVSRRAVFGDALWLEVAPGYSGSRATIVAPCWLRNCAAVERISGPDDDDADAAPYYYKAAARDVALYSEPRRTASLAGDIGRWECVRCVERRWDATSNEMWARLDEGESARWACVSERRADASSGLALESVELTGFFLNAYARNYGVGQLPLRDAPSLVASTKVAALPPWVVVRALSLVLGERETTNTTKRQQRASSAAVGTLWVEIAMVERSCWAIHANANTGIVVLEPVRAAVARGESDAIFRNVYAKGALQLRSRDDFMAEATGRRHPAAAAAAAADGKKSVTLGACVGVRQLALAPTGQLWAECRPVVSPPSAPYAWAIARSLVDGAPTLARLIDQGEGPVLYRVAEDLAVRPAPRESTVSRVLARGSAFVGRRRAVDDRGELWIQLSDDEWVAESAGGVQDSAVAAPPGCAVLTLEPDDVDAQRAAAERSFGEEKIPPPRDDDDDDEDVVVDDESVLASLDTFAEAASRADGFEEDVVDETPLDPPALEVVVVVDVSETRWRRWCFSKKKPTKKIVARVSSRDPRATVALLHVETPERATTSEERLLADDRRRKTAVFSLEDSDAAILKATVASDDRRLASDPAVFHPDDREDDDDDRRTPKISSFFPCCCCCRRRRRSRTITTTSANPLDRRATSKKKTYARLPTTAHDDAAAAAAVFVEMV